MLTKEHKIIMGVSMSRALRENIDQKRSLKHFHDKGILFTAKSLISQGVCLIQNTSPQQYFPTCIKAELIENLKKRKSSVLVQPTGVNLTKGTLN